MDPKLLKDSLGTDKSTVISIPSVHNNEESDKSESTEESNAKPIPTPRKHKLNQSSTQEDTPVSSSCTALPLLPDSHQSCSGTRRKCESFCDNSVWKFYEENEFVESLNIINFDRV